MWKFTDTEFWTLWRDRTEEFLPEPLFYTSRIESHVMHNEEMARIRASLPEITRSDFREVLDCIQVPDIRIEVRGWNGKNELEAKGRLSLLAARRGSRGVLVSQEPGETLIHAAGFTVEECDAIALATAVVNSLPTAERGQREDFSLPIADSRVQLDYDFGKSPVSDDTNKSAYTTSASFMSAPAVRIGTIEIIQGRSVYGPRGITRHHIEWRDIEGDGRYTISDENPRRVTSMDAKRLTILINTKIAAVVSAIKDER